MSDLIQSPDQHQSRRFAVTQDAIPPSRAFATLEPRVGHSPLLPGRAVGFSLIEVLVAVLVVSVGLLGLAALQIAGLKVTESAQLRTRVTMAAYDVIDRLRADPRSLLNAGVRQLPATTCNNTIDGAGALGRWHKDFCAFGLPPPAETGNTNAVTIDCQGDGCGPGNCEIVIYWDDSRGGNVLHHDGESIATSGDKSFRVCTRLPI